MSEATQADVLAAALEAASRVRVVSGTPDDSEVAALVAGLASVVGAGGFEEPEPEVTSQWSSRRRIVHSGVSLSAGADEWRWSLRG